MGVGLGGDSVATTNASADPPTWRYRLLAGTLRSVSCGTPAFCVATNNSSAAFVTRNADDGTPNAWTWSPGFQILGFNTLTDAACPGETLCLAVDDAGRVLSTRNPTAPDPEWKAVRPLTNTDAIAVSCPSISLCVVAGRNGSIRLTRNANAATPAWVNGPGYFAQLADLTCPTVQRCIGIDIANGAKVLRDLDVVPAPPDGPVGPQWDDDPSAIDGAAGPQAVSCPSATHCVVVDGSGNVLATNDVGAGDPVWVATNTSGVPLRRRLVPLDGGVRRVGLRRSARGTRPTRSPPRRCGTGPPRASATAATARRRSSA